MCTLIIFSILIVASMSAAEVPITLAANGDTDYIIAGDRGDDDIDAALDDLSALLQQATGATFALTDSGAAASHQHRIVVGDNALSRALLGDGVIDGLHVEESLVHSAGADLVLIGGSPRASAYAVYSFLESVGCRWYALHLAPIVRRRQTLTIAATSRRQRPAFTSRRGAFLKMADQAQAKQFVRRNRLLDVDEFAEIGPVVHTMFFYIPPAAPQAKWDHWGHPPKSGFFKTHPEYFAQDKGGARTTRLQLCFSNPELRKVLTEQIDAHIKAHPFSNPATRRHTKAKIALDANDVPGNFCYCDHCEVLAAKYENIGGPLYDYLFELSAFLEEEHPDVYVKILAYRKKQTELPPKVDRMPANVIVQFAPIDDNLAVPLEHPSNRETLTNLEQWCLLADHVWLWNYVNPFISGGPPHANLRRGIADIRTCHRLGIEGVFFQQTTATTDAVRGLNFADLQAWLLMRLSWNPAVDAGALIDDFLDAYYGSAAPLMRDYIDELERLREAMTIRLPWNPSYPMFTYITPPRLSRWSLAFDEMERLVAGSPDHLRHVRTARITLDAAVLVYWRDVQGKTHVDADLTAQQLADRLKTNLHAEVATRVAPGLEQRCWGPFEGYIDRSVLKAGIKIEPLPAQAN